MISSLSNLPPLIGYLAGMIGVAANAPQVFDLLRHPEKGLYQNLLRNLLLATSNGLWVTYGLFTRAWPVVIMCAVAASMLIIIVGFVLRARIAGGE